MKPRIANISFVFALTMALLTSNAVLGDVEDLRLWRESDHTRLVFELSKADDYTLFTLTDPDRVVIDIDNARLARNLTGFDLRNSPIRSIRTARREDNSLRVVLDLTARVNPTSSLLSASDGQPARLVVDLYDLESPRNVVAAYTTPVAKVEEKRDLIVAVVAGHGGDDPGALSYDRKMYEKDVTLAISRAIGDRLNKIPGYKSLLVRDGDYTVKLQDRPKIGRENRVDIYLSIHADSAPSRAAQGITIYALSGETADEENARRISQKENRTDLLGGLEGDTSISDVDDDLALTLLDLSMAWSIEQSVILGTNILDSLGGVARLRRDKVQAGNLWELRSPDIPSLLIETGYLSNPEEAQKLANPGYQEQLASAIVDGVMNYFYAAPPAGTLVAWQKENGIKPNSAVTSYTVKRGDSLSVIAQRYGMTLNELKSRNKLTSNTIHVGQVLSLIDSTSTTVAEHTIRRGETLSGIAQRYQVSLSRLRSVNNISGDRIMVGQVLQIPTI